MQVSIVGRHVELTDELQDYAAKRLEKLKKYFPNGPVDVHVVFYTQKYMQFAEATIMGNGFTVHAEESSETLYSSIDLLVDKLDEQLRRHKERVVKRHQKQKEAQLTREQFLNLNYSVFYGEELEQAEGIPQVIHTKRLAIKPMSVDEALLQMDLVGQDFLVFRNGESQKINVLYRRKDGNYGLIEPEDETA